MTIEDDIRFFIAGKVACSDDPLQTLNEIKECIQELERMYKWRYEDWKGTTYEKDIRVRDSTKGILSK